MPLSPLLWLLTPLMGSLSSSGSPALLPENVHSPLIAKLQSPGQPEGCTERAPVCWLNFGPLLSPWLSLSAPTRAGAWERLAARGNGSLRDPALFPEPVSWGRNGGGRKDNLLVAIRASKSR